MLCFTTPHQSHTAQAVQWENAKRRRVVSLLACGVYYAVRFDTFPPGGRLAFVSLKNCNLSLISYAEKDFDEVDEVFAKKVLTKVIK